MEEGRKGKRGGGIEESGREAKAKEEEEEGKKEGRKEGREGEREKEVKRVPPLTIIFLHILHIHCQGSKINVYQKCTCHITVCKTSS